MRWRAGKRQAISAAQRGQIVQHVIVDGWATARAAAQFDLSQRLVKVWVADYRRRGMASLRHVPRKTVAAEILVLRLLSPVAAMSRWAARGLHWRFADRRPAVPATMPRAKDDRRGGST